MLDVNKKGIILQATERDFENQAVLNPACYFQDGIIHMFYRAVHEGNYSSIGYTQFSYPDHQLIYRSPEPIIKSEGSIDRHGIEDPRITFLDGQFYLTYTAYDGQSTSIYYATTDNLPSTPKTPTFTPKGRISPALTIQEIAQLCQNDQQNGEPNSDICEIWNFQKNQPTGSSKYMWDKDGILFPERINDRIAFLHRLRPNIQLIYCHHLNQLNPDITDEIWEDNLEQIEKFTVIEQDYDYENSYVGGGCPPIKTDHGWLLIYHAVQKSDQGNIYHASAALLDLKQPTRLLAKLPFPLFSPTELWEVNGDVNNVVFPTGAFIKDNQVFIYYGAGDKQIAYVTVNYQALIDELHHNLREQHPQEYCETREKPWGQEVVFTPPELERVGKLINIKAGKRLSLQYHDEKEETMCLLSGEAQLWYKTKADGTLNSISMLPHQGYTIPKGLIHRIEAITDCWIDEVSSIETGTTYRLEDDYKRPDEER